MLYRNGVIWTGDCARPWARALWVEGGVVRAVGPEAEVAAAAGAGTAVTDLRGAFLCPGLVDAHCHVLGFGLALERVDLTGAASLDDALRRLAAAPSVRAPASRAGWILGRGWDQNLWPGSGFPGRLDLDRILPEAPVSLSRVDGHALWVNSRALAEAGITRATPDPPGGRIVRDAAGEPTGILIDAAMDRVARAIPPTGSEAKARAIARSQEALAAAGLTAVHDMGMSAGDLAVYRESAAAGAIRVRVYAALGADEPRLPELLAAGPDREWGRGRFRLGMVKFYVDGALGSRGAALLEPYADDPGNSGLLLTEPAALREGLVRVARAGFQCAVHAIGDRANRVALDAWEAILAGGAWGAEPPPDLSSVRPGPQPPGVRPGMRLEHAQILAPADLARVGRLGVLASVQPTHCTTDMAWASARLGEARLAGAYAWRTLADEGAVLAIGSDFPVEPHDPRFGLHAAVTRCRPGGTPPGGWRSGQRLGREEALAAATAAPAYASGDLARAGTLAPGKVADLSVFDTNLVTCDPAGILSARTLLTVVGGETVYRDPAGFGEEGERA